MNDHHLLAFYNSVILAQNEFSEMVCELTYDISGYTDAKKIYYVDRCMVFSHTSAKLMEIKKTSLQKIHGLHESGG